MPGPVSILLPINPIPDSPATVAANQGNTPAAELQAGDTIVQAPAAAIDAAGTAISDFTSSLVGNTLASVEPALIIGGLGILALVLWQGRRR